MTILKNILPSLAYLIVRIQCIIHVMYKICIKQLLMLRARLLANRLLVIKFQGHQKLYVDFPLGWSSAPLTPTLVKGQLNLGEESPGWF